MKKLNRAEALIGYKFSPLVRKVVYKSMRKKPIAAMELKKASELTDMDLTNVKFVAHRGLSGTNPENTAPAFIAAGEQGGYYGFECDTHMTKDGVWMVVHDENLDSLFNGDGDIKDFTYDELIELKMLRGANIGKFLDVKMPTLQEYIDICKKYKARPVIEIKDPRPETMPSFYEMLVKNDIVSDAVVISFNIDDLAELHKIDESIEMWYLIDYINDKNIKAAIDAGCRGIDFAEIYNAPRPDWIKKVIDAGLTAACWTVDNKVQLEDMLSAGVTVITTNSILPE